MKLKISLFMFLLLGSVVIGQELFVCENYTEDGTPVDVMEKVKIRPGGEHHYLLLKDKKIIDGSMVYLFIDKFVNGNFEPFESNPIHLDREKNWLVYEYFFREEGRYKINIVSSSNKLLASKRVNVTVEEEYLEPQDTYYETTYSTRKIKFAEAILGGKPANIVSSLKLQRENNVVFIYLDNRAPLHTTRIRVEIERDNDGNKDFEEKVTTKKYKVQPDWKDTYFRYEFDKAGIYKFTVFNELDLMIDYGYFTVYQ